MVQRIAQSEKNIKVISSKKKHNKIHIKLHLCIQVEDIEGTFGK